MRNNIKNKRKWLQQRLRESQMAYAITVLSLVALLFMLLYFYFKIS